MNYEERSPLPMVIIAIIAIIAFIAFLFLNPSEMISSGHRGVQVQFGEVREEILPEGFNWVNPLNHVIEMNVQVRKMEVEANAASKDLQAISAKIAVNYHLQPDKVNKLYQTLREDYEDRLIYPSIVEYMKKSTSQFTAEELVTKREAVKQDLYNNLKVALADNYIIIDDVFFTDFDFSEQFNKSIEEKVKVDQERLTEKNRLEKVRYQNEQKLSTARTDAESIRIQAQAITQQGGKDYVQLKAIEKWDGKLPMQMIPGSTVPFVNLTK